MKNNSSKFTREEIEEYLFDLRQDKYSAERQILEQQKLLEETIESTNRFEIAMADAKTPEEVEKWQDGIQNNYELHCLLKNRIVVLEESLDTINQVLLRFIS